MTAPLTPPPPPHEHSSASHQGQPAPAGAHLAHPGYGAPVEPDGPGLKAEVRQAAVITVAVAVSGALLGVLWWWLAPSVPLVGDVVDKSWVVYLKDSEGEQAVGVDGTFTLLALAFGLVSALAVFLLRRRGGVPLVVALGVGGLLGALLAWRVGVWLGPAQDVVAHAREAGKGVTFSAPLKLGAKGALLAWPLAGLLAHLGLTALFGPRDPEPVEGV
ncbi:AAA family ATPase [Streptomyces sp. JW3]|uniref:AAA family ATPase n=1 Tax=Streptomyces sp. JW3 TaxID=3456955 RepID=UPI003FA4B90E